MSILFLVKKNDELISHCKCEESLAGDPGQLDCPWCGCGWLFSCTKCRKAFTFAEAKLIDKTWEEIAREDILGFSSKEPTKEAISEWVDCMQHMMSHLVVGKTYVYLDGCFIPTDEEDFEFEGWKSKHNFYRPPQVIALEDKEIIDSLLSNPQYWEGNAIPEQGI